MEKIHNYKCKANERLNTYKRRRTYKKPGTEFGNRRDQNSIALAECHSEDKRINIERMARLY